MMMLHNQSLTDLKIHEAVTCIDAGHRPTGNRTERSAVMAVGHVWKSSVYIFLLTLFCVIAPWNLDFQSSLNLAFSRSYSLRRLEVQESTAKCLSSCSADGLARRHIGIHLIKRVRFTRCRINYYNNCDASLIWSFSVYVVT